MAAHETLLRRRGQCLYGHSMPPLRKQGCRLGFPHIKPLPLGDQGFPFGPLGLIECPLGVCIHEPLHTRLLVLGHLCTRQRP